MNIPQSFRLVYKSSEIDAAVSRLAQQILPWAESVLSSSGRELVVTPVLRGGIVFFADLVRQIPVPLEWEPVRASAYVNDSRGIAQREVAVDVWGFDPTNRCILVIDEICDTGRTYAAVVEKLTSLGAKEVKSAALVCRVFASALHIPNYMGFEYEGKEWLAGYGLKGGGHYGNLRDIYAILP